MYSVIVCVVLSCHGSLFSVTSTVASRQEPLMALTVCSYAGHEAHDLYSVDKSVSSVLVFIFV